MKNPRTENGKEKKIRKFRKREKVKKGKQRGKLDLEDDGFGWDGMMDLDWT